ncbi:MAG: hypothetical protein LBQ86_02460 [Holophagales bacterium]|jgi:hypothetical protein|nr:hypothetical protein [Holophagales bacterium]
MIPFNCMPGAKQWARGLPGLAVHNGPLWVCGPFGSGVSTLAQWLAAQRGTTVMEYDSAVELSEWLKANPIGVVASEQPADAISGNNRYDFLELRLWPVDDDPYALQTCLEHLAKEEGVSPPFPPALTRLPCDGNLRELRNRLIRWHLLGQAPESEQINSARELLEAEDIASNLHILERVLLHRALRRSYGNRLEAAKRLNVSRRQLYLLIERHGDPMRGEPPKRSSLKRVAKTRLVN